MIFIKNYLFRGIRLYTLIVAVMIIALAIMLLSYLNFTDFHTAKLVMGAALLSHKLEPDSKVTLKPNIENYFRPSKLPILNTRILGYEPSDRYKTHSPEDSIINYFSILREAENLTKDKSGGCGTVGNAKASFPIAYSFLTPEYQKKITFKQYLKSFEGIGHTNLIKLRKLYPDLRNPKDMRYFVEIETIEGSDKGVTYFAYYYGFIYIKKQENKYLISDMVMYGEDFLCAPYHGWFHDAEANVAIRYGDWCKLIEKKYPAKQEGYVKQISFKGTDGNDYMIEFMQLTNDTDIEAAQYMKGADGEWKVVYLNPEKCLEKKQQQ